MKWDSDLCGAEVCASAVLHLSSCAPMPPPFTLPVQIREKDDEQALKRIAEVSHTGGAPVTAGPSASAPRRAAPLTYP